LRFGGRLFCYECNRGRNGWRSYGVSFRLSWSWDLGQGRNEKARLEGERVGKFLFLALQGDVGGSMGLYPTNKISVRRNRKDSISQLTPSLSKRNAIVRYQSEIVDGAERLHKAKDGRIHIVKVSSEKRENKVVA